MAEILDEFIREYEANWLEEPIPALDGHTPQQADDDTPGRMSAQRLRLALGLE